MTRAPLPGKLPEWPEWQEDDLDYAGYYHELAICWESRARLAIAALDAMIDSYQPHVMEERCRSCNLAWVKMREAVVAIGHLPEEDRT